jgi:hypothetical protein
MTLVEQLKIESKAHPLDANLELFYTAAEKIEALEKSIKKHQRFILAIKPYLALEGYAGFVENIDELMNIEESPPGEEITIEMRTPIFTKPLIKSVKVKLK